MILKLRTMDEGWVYYNIDRKIKVRPLTKEQYRFGLETNTPERLEIDTDYLDGKTNGNCWTSGLKVINFEDANRCNGESIIYTNLTAFLINDEGKTIERIN